MNRYCYSRGARQGPAGGGAWKFSRGEGPAGGGACKVCRGEGPAGGGAWYLCRGEGPAGGGARPRRPRQIKYTFLFLVDKYFRKDSANTDPDVSSLVIYFIRSFFDIIGFKELSPSFLTRGDG